MAYVVQGKNCILYADRGGDYFPFACGQEFSLSETTEMIPTTTVGSGKFRTYMSRFSEWQMSVSGVMLLRKGSDYVALELFTDAVRENGLNIKAIWEDDEGALQELTGSVLFPEKSITATVGQITKWVANMQGNGDYTLGELDLSGVGSSGSVFSSEFDSVFG